MIIATKRVSVPQGCRRPDRPDEPELDDLVRKAAAARGAPIASVRPVDGRRRWVRGKVGSVLGWRIWACATCLLVSSHATARGEGPAPRADDAPEKLVVRADIRARTEAIGGQFRPGATKDDFLQSFRTTVFAEYDAGPLRVGGELRDARGYGQDRRSSAGVSEINAIEPIQAYVAADLQGGGDTRGTLYAGRFTLDIGAGRLVARPDFANSVNTYTGALFDGRSGVGDRLALFWTMPSTRLPNEPERLRRNAVRLDPARDTTVFFGGSLTKSGVIGPVGVETYAYRLAENDSAGRPTRDRHLVTLGARIFRPAATGHFDLDVEGARQTGRVRASALASDRADLPVKAQFVHAEIGRKFASRWSPRLSVQADYASGDDRDPARWTRFDPLFGAPRADFGPTGLYGAVNRSNLVSGGARLDLTPSPRLDGFAAVRALWLDRAADAFSTTGVRDRSGRSGRYAGAQLEGRVRYWLVPAKYRIEGGGAYLAKARFLRDGPNAPATGDTRYLYLDLIADL